MNSTKKNSSKKRWSVLLLLLLLLLIIGLLITFWGSKKNKGFPWWGSTPNTRPFIDSLSSVDYLDKLDSLFNLDSLALQEYFASLDSLNRKELLFHLDSLSRIDSLASADSLAIEGRKRADSIATLDSLRKVLLDKQLENDSLKHLEDSLLALRRDSLQHQQDSIQAYDDSVKVAEASMCKDTIAPWIYPDPSGGLHTESINVTFYKSEVCTILVSNAIDGRFVAQISPLAFNKDTTLFYYAVDTCGNVSDTMSRVYTFKIEASLGICPDGMAYVNVEENSFCIDQYEWPNRKGSIPTTNVAYAEAQDSCYLLGKRLCSAHEWTSACEGPYSWTYPYGGRYEQHTCATQEKSSRKSGSSPACRSWSPIYDMVGNVAEWTDTPAKENSRFYVVKGGFWESGKKASCQSERYSYYPNNPHNPVGFRCCKDLSEVK